MKGEHFDHLAEGAPTVKALVKLGEEHGVDLPICQTIYSMLYEAAVPRMRCPACSSAQ